MLGLENKCRLLNDENDEQRKRHRMELEQLESQLQQEFNYNIESQLRKQHTQFTAEKQGLSQELRDLQYTLETTKKEKEELNILKAHLQSANQKLE